MFSFIDKDTSYWRFTFLGMLLYIAGVGTVYITANFVVAQILDRVIRNIHLSSSFRRTCKNSLL
ncbi:hypothetical protein BJ875DRAFT_477186 [Amylocarpus encephaloides]|uniref:Uncharacterized protein n=1 Tax=Amylocarpus encephaloides TaxID=45428 RepID=A0A9P7Y8G1_9HELO|nr:hypothetical protein BJ875DRAFT_477186 [Amylocarpus encephaloides]